ncbi:MAG TPA: ComEC/Rec2 family competence protein [Gemmatimonadota bacterium]
MRSFAGRHPSLVLFLALTPALLLAGAGQTAGAAVAAPAAACVVAGLAGARSAATLLVLAAALVPRTACARSDRLAEARAWRAQQAGPLAVLGRVEARGPAGDGRERLLFVVRAAGSPDGALEPRRGAIRLYAKAGAAPPTGGPALVQGRFRPARRPENPGTLDWALLPGGPRVRGALLLSSWTPSAGGGAPPLQRLREALSAQAASLLPPLSGGFLQAALFGDREALDPRLREVFSRTGTGHIVAISGMNVAILAAIGGAVLTPLVRRAAPRRLVLAGLLLLYVPLAGSAPSVVRASLMASAALAAAGAGRRVLLPNALGAAGLGLLALQPEALRDPSFQLSFVAVGGLALLPPLPGRRIAGGRAAASAARSPAAAALGLERGGPGPAPPAVQAPVRAVGRLAGAAVDLSLVTVASSVATLPLTLPYFRRVPLLAVPANLIVVPVLGVLTAGGLAAIVASWAAPPLAGAWAGACDALLLAAFRALEACAAPSWAWPALAGARASLAAAALAVTAAAFAALRLRAVSAGLPGAVRSGPAPREPPAAGGARGTLARGPVAAAAALAAALAVGHAVRGVAPDAAGAGELEIAVLSVGQGDAVALLPPRAGAMLVDGGPPEAAEAVVAFLHERGVRRLARAFATHPDADHVGGLAGVLEAIPADTVHDPGQWGAGAPYRRWLESSARARAGYRPLAAGDRIVHGDLVVEVLWPPPRAAGVDPYWSGTPTNELSLVLRVSWRGLRAILPGDVGAAVEERLAREHGAALASHVLKAAHHGSRHSSSGPFLAAVSPAFALVSAGAGNRHGHPHPDALARLGGARVRRTDLEGALLVRSDGDTVEVRGWVSGRIERLALSARSRSRRDGSSRGGPPAPRRRRSPRRRRRSRAGGARVPAIAARPERRRPRCRRPAASAGRPAAARRRRRRRVPGPRASRDSPRAGSFGR